MTRKSILGIAVVLALAVVSATAFAGWGPGGGWGMNYGHMGYSGHMGYGPGMRGACGPGYQGTYDEETTKLLNEFNLKARELNAALAAPEADRDKVKALQNDLTTLRGEIDQKNLDAELEFRKSNPDYQGYGPGYGRGHWGGRGYGYCWN